MTFADCVLACFDDAALMAEYRRLYGSKLGLDRRPRSGIEALVDDAAGFDPSAVDPAEGLAFIAWVWDCVWTRLPREAFE